MQRYETLILTRTQITADELSMLENYFDKLLSDAKGSLLAFDKWGKYRLAYPVNKSDYGIYLLARYEMPEEAITSTFKKVAEFFKIKCNEIVMRNVTVKLDAQAPLAYKYPDPIDGGKAGLDTFLKENKMESLLESVGEGKEGQPAQEQAKQPVENTETEVASEKTEAQEKEFAEQPAEKEDNSEE